ncbi:unnamed protein product, partial [Polarella glacialis]
VEIVSHGAVMFLSEVLGVHQKQMGYDYEIVRMYLSDKRYLFWACLSFEAFGLGLIVNHRNVVLISLPGFLFRATANLCRLAAIVMAGPRQKEKTRWPEVKDEFPRQVPSRGSSDRLGHHRAASPPGAQIVRRKRTGSAKSSGSDHSDR